MGYGCSGQESVAGLKWTPPAGWKSNGTASMRAATYPEAPVQGDQDAAECVVYFFGLGQGGSIRANIDRWEEQFKTPGGKPAPAKVTQITIHGLPVTTIDVSGEYSGMAGRGRFFVDRGWWSENWAIKLRRPKVSDSPTMPFTRDETCALLSACQLFTDWQPQCPGERTPAAGVHFTLAVLRIAPQ